MSAGYGSLPAAYKPIISSQNVVIFSFPKRLLTSLLKDFIISWGFRASKKVLNRRIISKAIAEKFRYTLHYFCCNAGYTVLCWNIRVSDFSMAPGTVFKITND